ncbi:hypothetical protein DH2020_014823 [Rehmannia glutinosa]|uniref:Uncharacterized protein n=1 Tax=Rehmannia glutinosa TaxID=99300 RepID=A0ABR0WXK1_REHGL
MAMSRIFSQSLSRSSLRPRQPNQPPPPPLQQNPQRSDYRSGDRPGLFIADRFAGGGRRVITLGIKKLEDAIHSIVVRRSAPDWLPFLPGYSYWVPPRASAMRGVQHHPAGSMIDVIGRLAASGVKRNRGLQLDLLSEDENMAFTSARGWPASAFYIEGTSPVHPIPVVEVEVTVLENEDQSNSTSDSEDAEG